MTYKLNWIGNKTEIGRSMKMDGPEVGQQTVQMTKTG